MQRDPRSRPTLRSVSMSERQDPTAGSKSQLKKQAKMLHKQQAKAELQQAKESGNLDRLKEMKAAILKAQSSSQLNRANLATHNKTWDQKAVRALHVWPCMCTYAKLHDGMDCDVGHLTMARTYTQLQVRKLTRLVFRPKPKQR